jgi:sulfide dehydrogenase cytochrome subunit
MEETMRNKLLIALATLGLASLSAHAGPTEDLARTCNACHGLNGVSVGPSMPSIAGLPEKYLKSVLLQWKSGERYSATMGRHFTGYTEAELAALATYFSKLPYVAVVQPADAKVMARGKEATERCETCHGATGGAPDDDETPKLNGQWAQYGTRNDEVPRREHQDAPQEDARQREAAGRGGCARRRPVLRRPAQVRRPT